ncbi:hypothetical protein [uncultured Gilvimarinus sp.]|uniref:hypothetical protein n=1 Tax=uncultured Gilvimarinus sp. TaxID=1689143 RepID=UPI0030EEA3EE|tara:strand:- start:387 stop:599 length:213 start_codon:yes stop_codon:yes gene_type:complete
MKKTSNAEKIACLQELAAWRDKYGVEINYTGDDDGLHVSFGGGFMDDPVAIGYVGKDINSAISKLEAAGE